MHRTLSSIRRNALNAALGLLLLVLAGCGHNPVAPVVTPSSQSGAAVTAKVEKNPNHANGLTRRNPGSSSSMTPGSMKDPWEGESDEGFLTE